MADRTIFLIGFMGCGKSTVSKILADKLRLKMIDSDEYIENCEKMKITEMFEKYGEEYFRERETDFLRKIGEIGPAVVACGGGMAVRRQNAELMKEKGIVIFLTAKPETIYERVRYSSQRPLLNNNMNIGYITKLMEGRMPAYESAGDCKVETDGRAPEDIADEIIEIYSNI